MRIERLELKNFRVIEDFAADFDPGFNLFIGENGRGKTTILECLRRVLVNWTAAPGALMEPGDTRATLRSVDGVLFKELHPSTHVGVAGAGPDGLPFTAVEGTKSPPIPLGPSAGRRADRLWTEANRDPTVALPLLALFSPWREPPRRRRPKISGMEPQARFYGYKDAFDLHADIQGLASWLRTWDEAAIQEARTFEHVEAAREAICACLPDCADIRYRARERDVMICQASGDWEPLWRLSDGYRTMAALIGEMAWRAAILNPGLAGAPQRVAGVVLIDELDLHLHPRWQRRVVSDLQRAFPRVQFFATTHSPFIVQSMRSEQVFNLDDRPSMQYWREGIEDIAHESMGVDDGAVPRSRLYRELEQVAEEYYRLIDESPQDTEAIAAREQRLRELEQAFTDNPALAAFLRTQRRSRGGGAD